MIEQLHAERLSGSEDFGQRKIDQHGCSARPLRQRTGIIESSVQVTSS